MASKPIREEAGAVAISIYRSESGKPTAIKSVNGVFALMLTVYVTWSRRATPGLISPALEHLAQHQGGRKSGAIAADALQQRRKLVGQSREKHRKPKGVHRSMKRQ